MATLAEARKALVLPHGAGLTWARGIMAELPATPGARPTLSWWATSPGEGTPLVWADDPDVTWMYFGSAHPRTTASEALSDSWVKRLLREPQLARQLSGVFALLIWDKQAKRLIGFTDRLGVQALHCAQDAHDTWRISTHLSWLLLASEHDGTVNPEGFISHMAFGYGVDPHREVYRHVRAVAPGGYVQLTHASQISGRYWTSPDPSSDRLHDVESLVSTLRTAMRASADNSGAFLGLTAGKDSLCLASAVPEGWTPHTGTLGLPGCADQAQGVDLARLMGWSHTSAAVCNEAEFFQWADYIAFQSAGLSTASYVDMASFVSARVPRGFAFVMGEGGECVRDFFGTEGRPPLETLVNDYMTPTSYLHATLAGPLSCRLTGYPDQLVQALRATSEPRDDVGFVSHFYRSQRMPGNFSLRHAVLSVLRPKLSPFLDARFIDGTYALSTAEHANSAIHRRLIAFARPDLLRFFDAPAKSAQSTQDWHVRFPRIAARFKQLLTEILPFSDDVLDPPGVLALCDTTAERPSRAIYHLFRLYSFAHSRAVLQRGASTRLATVLAECQQVPVDA